MAKQARQFQAAHEQGVLAIRAGRFHDALRWFTKAVAADPKSAAAHSNRGIALAQLGRPAEARACFERAIALQPKDPNAHNNLGNVLRALGRHKEALASYTRAVELRPDFPEALNNRGTSLRQMGRHQEALASFDRALALRPDAAETHNNRGVALQDLGRHEEAVASIERALALRPNYTSALTNRTIGLHMLGHHAEALANLDLVLAKEPRDAGLWSDRGNVLHALGRYDDALASYATSRRYRPDDIDLEVNEGICRLAMGDFAQGFRQYEYRWRQPGFVLDTREFAQPRWTGEGDIAGKTLLLSSEQGFGDTLQFCRYAMLAAEQARVVLEVQPQLVRILSTLPGVDTVIARGDAPPPFDLHCPMLSLPMAFGTTVETIPAPGRYLTAAPDAVAEWRRRLSALPRPHVGLRWAGNRISTAINPRRSITLAHYAPLAAIGGVTFISLQEDAAGAQAQSPPPGMALQSWVEELADFADTAALAEALDLVITVDTAVAHLVGALGKKVWILNRFDACWRWLRDRDDSPWYPSARLFRQPEPGDWNSVINRVAGALRSFRDQTGSA